MSECHGILISRICCLQNKKYHAYRIKGIVRLVAQDFRIYDNFWIKNMIKVSCNYMIY
jgi:hypothetical protein